MTAHAITLQLPVSLYDLYRQRAEQTHRTVEAELLEAVSVVAPEAQELPHAYIETTSGVRGGKPRIQGTRITVSDIALMHRRLGQSLEEIAGAYDLSLSTVYAAMAYYHDHREEIDRSIEEDRAFAEAFRRNNPSPLQEKLAALNRV